MGKGTTCDATGSAIGIHGDEELRGVVVELWDGKSHPEKVSEC